MYFTSDKTKVGNDYNWAASGMKYVTQKNGVYYIVIGHNISDSEFSHIKANFKITAFSPGGSLGDAEINSL